MPSTEAVTVSLTVTQATANSGSTGLIDSEGRSEDVIGVGGIGGVGGLRSALADAERRRDHQEHNGDLMLDRAKMVACGAILVLHGIVLAALDVVMIRRRCSGMQGCAFVVLAASVSAMLSGSFLSMQRAFNRRGVAAVAGLWATNLAMDACWLGLTLGRPSSECLGTAMIGVTAVGLVSCPASLVAFVILFGWFGRSKAR